MKKNYKLFIGLNVADGKDWERSDAVNIIITVCKQYNIIALSLSDMQGVYTYNSGAVVFESTLVLTLVDCNVDIVKLCEALKKSLKQECIMLQEVFDKFSFI